MVSGMVGRPRMENEVAIPYFGTEQDENEWRADRAKRRE